MRNSNNSAFEASEKLDQQLKHFITALIAITSGMTWQGFRIILSGDGWEKEAIALALAFGVFCAIHILMTSQKMVFVELKRHSRLAISTHILAVLLILSISPPSNLVTFIHGEAAILSLQSAQKKGEKLGGLATRTHHATTSLSSLLIAHKEKADSLAKRAIAGDLTTVAGFGPVAKRYATISEQLDSAINLVDEFTSKGEPIIHAMDSAASRMGNIIEQQSTLEEKVPLFEASYRAYIGQYNRLSSLNVGGQLRALLNSLSDTAIAESAKDRTSRNALFAAEKFAQNISAEISGYLDANLQPLPVAEAFKLPSHAQNSFEHMWAFLPQVFIAWGIDGTLILLLWLRIAASRDNDDEHQNDNPRIALKDLELFTSSLNRLTEVRRDAVDVTAKLDIQSEGRQS